MGPPPRSFAADAHDCIVVAILLGRPNTSSWRAKYALPDGELPSVSSPQSTLNERENDTPGRPDAKVWRCARDRQGQVAARWPSATIDGAARGGPTKIRSGRGDAAR